MKNKGFRFGLQFAFFWLRQVRGVKIPYSPCGIGDKATQAYGYVGTHKGERMRQCKPKVTAKQRAKLAKQRARELKAAKLERLETELIAAGLPRSVKVNIGEHTMYARAIVSKKSHKRIMYHGQSGFQVGDTRLQVNILVLTPFADGE